MKRTLVVLALAVLSAAGCRAVSPSGCGDPCGGYGSGDPCGGGYGYGAPYDDACGGPDCYGESGYADYGYADCGTAGCGTNDCGPACGGTCGGGGCLDQSACCQGGCCLFQRYCGHDCGPGYGPGPYDCSPCGSPDWGCTGYRHPQGYVTGSDCHCATPRTQPLHAAVCGNGYCCAACGRPAPSCCCANSGDHIYNFNPGPPVAQTAYPYYTVRGPRDFLLDNPPPLGPY